MSTILDKPNEKPIDVQVTDNLAKPKSFGGRKQGSLNKATLNAKEAIARFVDDNASRLQEWLDEIRDTQGPQAAFRCYMDLIEYHVPKLSRSIVSGPDEGPIQVSWIMPAPTHTLGKVHISINEDGERVRDSHYADCKCDRCEPLVALPVVVEGSTSNNK